MGREVIITALVTGLLSSSIIVLTEEQDSTTLDPVERNSKTAQLCTDLKSYKQDFRMNELIKTVHDLWVLLFSDKLNASATTNETRIITEGHLNQILTECGIRTSLQTEFKRPNGRSAGVVDLRTVEEKDTTHLIIKHRYRKPSCGALNQLVQCMETEAFQTLYPSEKIIALSFSYNLRPKEVTMTDWVALLYQKGEVLDAREQAKCLRAFEFAELKFKDKLIREYFGSANGTA